MKSNQKGMLGTLEIAMIVVVVGILGFVGWKVLSGDKTADTTDTSTIDSYEECVAAGYPIMESYPEQCAVPGGESFTRVLTEEETTDLNDAIDEETDPEFKGYSVYGLDEPILINTKADLTKLPAYTAQSFIDYLEPKLDVVVYEDGIDCVTVFSVSQISEVNVSGSVSSADAGDPTMHELCGGGAAAYWYLKAGEWDLLGAQDIPGCDIVDETTIYSEFLETCYSTTTGEEEPNPNGSIKNTYTVEYEE